MRITKCRDQSLQSIEDYYAAESRYDDYAARGAAMLRLLARLGESSWPARVYGLTSHRRLVLLSENDYRSPSHVIVTAMYEQTFHVEYLMPERLAPWPGARVYGEASSDELAARMVELAMVRSEGWSARA